MANQKGRDRNPGRDPVVPAEGSKPEAQDRKKGSAGRKNSRSPVDAMHVDAPNKQDNERGHQKDEALKR